MLRRSRFRALALALLIPVAACERETVVGVYQATTFTFQQTGGTPVDVLAAGGSINLTINNDLSTSGTLVVPASVPGGPFSASMLGQAVVQGDIVTFTMVADSFMRDVEFTFDGNTLSGSDTFSGASVVVVLTK